MALFSFFFITAALIPFAAGNPSFQLGQITWVLGDVSDSQASACFREELDVSTHTVTVSSDGWSGAVLEDVAIGLGYFVSNSTIHGIAGCCSPSMWCRESIGCFTHGYSEFYSNPQRISSYQQPANIGRPVFTCLQPDPFITVNTISISTVVASESGLVTVSFANASRVREEAAAVSIQGTGCANAERCNNICSSCSSDLDCNLGQVCLSTYSNKRECFTYCGFLGNDDACPCGTICDSAKYSINSGFDIREIFLCTPMRFEAEDNECGGYDADFECTPSDRSVLGVANSVNVSVANDASDADSYDDASNDRPYETEGVSTDSVYSESSNCEVDEDCNDGNICTLDSCLDNECAYSLVSDFFTLNGTGTIGCQSHRTFSFRRSAPKFYIQLVQTEDVDTSHTLIESILSDSGSYWKKGWDDFPMITEDVSSLSNGGLNIMGHLSREIAINPNAIIGFVPFPDCTSVYYFSSCQLFSSNTNMMAILASDWYPGVSTESDVNYRVSSNSYDILFSDVYLFGDDNLESANTFSASLWSDGSLRFRFHSITLNNDYMDDLDSGVFAATQFYGSYNEERTVSTDDAVPYFRTNFGDDSNIPQQAAPILDLLSQPADVTMCSVNAVACPKKSCGLSGEQLEIYWDGIDCDALADLESASSGPEQKDFEFHYFCIFAGFHFVSGSLDQDSNNRSVLSCTIPSLNESFASFGTADSVNYTSVLVSLEIFWNVTLADGEAVVFDSHGRGGMSTMDEGSNRNPKVVFGLSRVFDESASETSGVFHWEALSKATWSPTSGIVVSHDLMLLYGQDTCGCLPLSSAVVTETCDACNVCAGVGDTVDCNGDCLGVAFLDGCDNCVGGMTGEGSCLLENTSPAFVLEFASETVVLLIIIFIVAALTCTCAMAARSRFRDNGNDGFAQDLDDPNRGLLDPELSRIEMVPYKSHITAMVSTTTEAGVDVTSDSSGAAGVIPIAGASSLVPIAEPQHSLPGQTDCSICLCDFSEGEIVKQLPCAHLFHVTCIDVWLHNKPLCPLCKQNVRTMLEQQTREEAQASSTGGTFWTRFQSSVQVSTSAPSTTTGSRADRSHL